MKRYDRSRFIAWGALPAVNAVALLIHGLGLATHGTGGAGRSLPALVVMTGVCLLIALAAMVKRGRDVGWPVWVTVVVFWLSLGTGPGVLIVLGYLAFAKARPPVAADAAEPPSPPPAGAATWFFALLNLLWPWGVLAVLARLL